MEKAVKVNVEKTSGTSRRSFLKISGLTIAGTGLLLAGCSEDDEPSVFYPGLKDGVFDLGGGDFGVLTYAYALEQLEADFYTKVVNASAFNATFSVEEKAVLTDLYNHEVIHREFFKASLTGALPNPGQQLLPGLSFDYGAVNFNNRLDVLNTAKALEDTGVAAYNGAGKLLTNPQYLLLAGKIVSVEARHASAIRSLLNPNSKDFAGNDVVNVMNGLDVVKNPSEVLGIAGGFITTEFTAYHLP